MHKPLLLMLAKTRSFSSLNTSLVHDRGRAPGSGNECACEVITCVVSNGIGTVRTFRLLLYTTPALWYWLRYRPIHTLLNFKLLYIIATQLTARVISAGLKPISLKATPCSRSILVWHTRGSSELSEKFTPSSTNLWNTKYMNLQYWAKRLRSIYTSDVMRYLYVQKSCFACKIMSWIKKKGNSLGLKWCH